MADTRTSQELNSASFNYFIALKLGAKETNAKVIEKAIADIKAITDDNAYGERLKALTSDMERVMGDPEARKREAEAAVRFKLAEMMDLVKNIALSNGMLFKSELQTLRNNANKEAAYYTFPELEKEFLAFNANGAIQYIDDITGVRIPFKDFDRITESLQSSLRMTTLYEFLGVSSSASDSEIDAAKQKAYNEYMAKGDRSLRSLGKGLCGDVDTFLRAKDGRKNYDEYILLREKVWKQFALRRQYGAKSITLNEFFDFAQIVMDATKKNISDVQVLLGAGLKAYALTVAGGDKQGTGMKELELCPYPDCGKIYEAGAKNCPHCGRALEVLCWNCGSKMPFTMKSKTCGVCGASYQNKDLFQKNTAELDKLLAVPVCDLSKVQMALMGIKNLVPDYKKAGQSVIAKKVAEYEKEIEKRNEIERTKGVKYREQMKKAAELAAAKNFMQAKSAAEQVRRNFADYNLAETQKTIAEYDAALQKAQREFAAARTFLMQNNEEGAVGAALKALDIVADFNEAKQFIAKYPPKPPVNVRVSMAGNNAKLEWQFSSRLNTTYNVIRKVGTLPANAEDGTLVAGGLTIDFFEDKSVASATKYYYAVFAERGGVRSNISVCNTPVLFFNDVKNVRQELVEDKISVKWDAPNNVKQIEVWKKRGVVPPAQAGDGERLAATMEGFTDSDAGQISYLIVCRYDVGGAQYASKGVSRTYKRYEILKKPENVQVARIDGCEFSFSANAAGKPRILFAPAKLACRIDVVQEAAAYTEAVKGAKELNLTYVGEKMSFSLPPDTVGYVYPVFYNDQLFIVSQPILLNTVIPIRNLHYDEQGSGGTLIGNLSPKISTVVAKVSERAFVKSPDEPADTITMSAADFTSKGGLELHLKRNVDYYITVFGETEINGKKIMGCPVSLDEAICQRDKVAVRYMLEYEASPMKPFKVTLKFAADTETEIPELLLMRGSPIPMDKSQGELVEKIGKAPLKKGMFSKVYTYKTVINAPPMARDMKFALFTASGGGYVQLKKVNNL